MIGLTSETPATHRFISRKEKNYIMERVPNLENKKVTLKNRKIYMLNEF